MKWVARTMPKEVRRRKRADWESSNSPTSHIERDEGNEFALNKLSRPSSGPKWHSKDTNLVGWTTLTPGMGHGPEQSGLSHHHSHLEGLRWRPKAVVVKKKTECRSTN